MRDRGKENETMSFYRWIHNKRAGKTERNNILPRKDFGRETIVVFQTRFQPENPVMNFSQIEQSRGVYDFPHLSIYPKKEHKSNFLTMPS